VRLLARYSRIGLACMFSAESSSLGRSCGSRWGCKRYPPSSLLFPLSLLSNRPPIDIVWVWMSVTSPHFVIILD
jgi:hypothetical protein